MRVLRHPVGYTLPALADRLSQVVYDPDTDTFSDQPLNLNDPDIARVRLTLRPLASTTLTTDADMDILPGAGGDVQYQWHDADVETKGRFIAIEVVDHVTGAKQPGPAFYIDFYDPAVVVGAGESPLAVPWVDAASLPCADAEGIDDYALAASELLYYASGQQFPGIAVDTVRPCGGLCGCGAYDVCATCRTPTNVATLLDPVVAIDEVRLAGDVLDPSAYRLFNRRILQRTDGAMWPTQNYQMAPGEPGTWTVTVRHGAQPPVLGTLAAADLACYFAKVYGGADCKLPAHVRFLSRQGINQQFDDKVVGAMSLQSVQLFLSTYPGQPDVWTPETPPTPLEVL